MIPSAYQIDFHDGTTAHRLLDYGEMLSADVATQFTQAAERYTPIGAPWGEGTASGGASISVAWGVIRKHASHAALRTYCSACAAAFPSGSTGTMRIAVEGGDSWLVFNVITLTAATSPRVPASDFETVSFITCTGGQLAAQPPPTLLPTMPALDFRLAYDATGYWSEVGFESDVLLTGSAATGWRDPAGVCRVRLQGSSNLLAWSSDGFSDCPGSPADLGGGSWRYWSRAAVPAYWQQTLIDLSASTSQAGKAITALSVYRVEVALPGYPYNMPADAARLQADLRAAGYAGATVPVTPGALFARAFNHTPSGKFLLPVTMAGTNVTAVSSAGVTIPLAYPYSLPTQRAALQSALRAAGQSGAVVMIYGDGWAINLPDRLAAGNLRDFSVTFTPGDPYPVWDLFGVYQGESLATFVNGESSNVRTPGGAPLLEAGKQFFRLKIDI